jgi:N6-adenosine-specific RNA methylase IME4
VTPFSVIVADCPWSYEDKLRMKGSVGVRRSADSHYEVMPLAEILGLRIPAADDSVLALWCPNALLHSHGYPTAKKWGFTPKQLFTWVKTAKSGQPRPGMGRMFRNATESAIIATRGSLPCLDHSQLNVDFHPWPGHSAKPDTLQERLELMFPRGPYLEMFARRQLLGWVCIGNEAPATRGEDINDSLARFL